MVRGQPGPGPQQVQVLTSLVQILKTPGKIRYLDQYDLKFNLKYRKNKVIESDQILKISFLFFDFIAAHG